MRCTEMQNAKGKMQNGKFGFVGEQFPSSVAYGDTFPPGGRLVCATFAIVWWRAIMASHEGEAVSEAD